MAKKKTLKQLKWDYSMKSIRDNPAVARECLKELRISKAKVMKGLPKKDVRKVISCMATKTLRFNPKHLQALLKAIKLDREAR
jgi:hypothetical protein